MPIAEFSNWLRRVIWGRILRGRHHGTRLWNSVDAKWLWRILQSSSLFSVFSNINGKHESTLTTSKKYSWCIPVQNEIKPIIWGAAITPEPYSVDLFSRIPTLESWGSYGLATIKRILNYTIELSLKERISITSTQRWDIVCKLWYKYVKFCCHHSVHCWPMAKNWDIYGDRDKGFPAVYIVNMHMVLLIFLFCCGFIVSSQ